MGTLGNFGGEEGNKEPPPPWETLSNERNFSFRFDQIFVSLPQHGFLRN